MKAHTFRFMGSPRRTDASVPSVRQPGRCLRPKCPAAGQVLESFGRPDALGDPRDGRQKEGDATRLRSRSCVHGGQNETHAQAAHPRHPLPMLAKGTFLVCSQTIHTCVTTRLTCDFVITLHLRQCGGFVKRANGQRPAGTSFTRKARNSTDISIFWLILNVSIKFSPNNGRFCL